MNIGSINDLDDAAVAFSAVRARSTQLVWYSEGALAEATGESWSQERFLDEFSFVTPDALISAQLTLDHEHVRTFKAERYGGVGVGQDGVGSRGGTTRRFQIKGIGVEPLLGRGDDEFHSYGGLDLGEGVAELANSIVLGRILPHGTVPCYGLICTARDAAHLYRPSKDGSDRRGPGSLLVRAACMSPAHFLRNASFDPVSRGDVHRTRRINKALHDRLPQRDDIIRALERFLAVCADQFGFAYVFRLRHGVLTPSNLSFDGRWLDVAHAAFVDSGKSYASVPSAIPSQEEPMAVLSILREFIYTYEKYNRTSFDVQPLIDYYHGQLDARIAYYYARLVGLPAGAFELVATEDSRSAAEQLVGALSRCITGEGILSVGGPRAFNDRDPLVSLIEDWFRHLQPGAKPRLANGNFQALQTFPAFVQLIDRSYEGRDAAAVSKRSFRIGCAVRALRKLYFSSFYYVSGTTELGAEVAALENPAQGAELIDEFCDVSRWLFDDAVRSEDALFQSRRLQISYSAAEEVFLVRRSASGETLRFARAEDLLEAVNRFAGNELRVRHFDFRKNLLRMLEVLRFFDQARS